MYEQIVVDVSINASRYFVMSMGILFVYKVAGFVDVSGAAMYTLGAYLSYSLVTYCEMSLILSTIVSVVTVAMVYMLIYNIIYEPMKKRNTSSMIMLLSSLGVYIICVNIVSLVWGDMTRVMISAVESYIGLLGARLTMGQALTIASVPCMWLLMNIYLNDTKYGRGLRAIGDNACMAMLTGVQSRLVLNIAYMVSGCLLCVVGVSSALDVTISPGMGMSALLTGVVVLIVSGARSLEYLALSALLLALVQHVAAWYLGSQYQEPVAFVVLMVVLVKNQERLMIEQNRVGSI